MRKVFSALIMSGLLLTGSMTLVTNASASHYTTIVYNCPTNKEGVRTNVRYTVPTAYVGYYDKELRSRGCTKVSHTPVSH